MSDTPETDAHQAQEGMAHDWLWRDFACKLERERNEWKEKCDKLAEALRELRDSEWLNMPGRANDIVEAALTAWKEARSES